MGKGRLYFVNLVRSFSASLIDLRYNSQINAEYGQ